MRLLRPILMVVMLATIAACAPPAQQASSGSGSQPAGGGQSASSGGTRTLVIGGRAELPSLSPNPLVALGFTTGSAIKIFNAGLTLNDGRNPPRPYLAESVPQLNTDSWRVFPDGKMETTYKLRPNLVWHDGTALTPEDFMFAREVYAVPRLGYSTSPPYIFIDEIVAPDSRTLVIRWNQPYADAGALDIGEGSSSRVMPALPRHILSQHFAQGDMDSFAALPFWNGEYVGLGPFKLERWEPGSHYDAVAFEQHALGRPKIDRLRLRYLSDFNAGVAAMLAGEVHINFDDSLRHQQGLILQREWGPRNGGTVLMFPGLWRWDQIQQRPELAQPRGLMDVRVRKALAHSVDKAGINEALFEGQGIMSETMIPSTVDYFAELDRQVAKYPYDLRRTEQLMAEAGYSRGSDGVWIDPSGQRFSTELAVLQSPVNESEMSISAAGWRLAGFDVKEVVWPAVAARDSELRNTHTGISGTGGRNGEDSLADHATSRLPTAQSRWIGSNRGGWIAPPEFDRLAAAFPITLDRAERTRMVIEMARIFSDSAAVISLYFSPTVTAFVSNLTGPVIPGGDASQAWNIHEWELR
jgi:peptide/nickel transport system substrate-binding protein